MFVFKKITILFVSSIAVYISAIFLATDGFRDEKIEYPSKQSNLRDPLKLSTTLNSLNLLGIENKFT